MKPWHMGTHLRVLSKCYPMNTSMKGFRALELWAKVARTALGELMDIQGAFQTSLRFCALDESISIGRVAVNLWA